jgi:choice-of-anchor B domain-containing protein
MQFSTRLKSTLAWMVVASAFGMSAASPLQACLDDEHGDPTKNAVGKGDEAFAPQGTGAGGPFNSLRVDLGDHLTIPQMGGNASTAGSDIWGWTDALTGREYALFGRSNGMSFVDITDPYNAVYLGNLPTRTGNSIWREMKTYKDHLYVVSDNNGAHGLQVFDLRQLRGVSAPQTFSSTVVRDEFTNAHNIYINEQSGYAYVVGSNQASGGPYIYDIRTPNNPIQVGRYSGDGYTHDLQVITYDGPDTTYAGREIGFNSNADSLTIVDFTNKSNPSMVSRKTYQQTGYTHQGWLSDDRRYFFMNDELDEHNFGLSVWRTLVWDVSDLDNPRFLGSQDGTARVIDHNLFVKDGYIYEANYTGGLRIMKIVDPANADLPEVAFFDTYPATDNISFNGAWGNYPFFDSGTVIVSDIQNGLFVLRPDFIESDIDRDGGIDCQDIDALQSAILAGSTNSLYDLNDDGLVNIEDRDAWLKDSGEDNLQAIRGYLPGDANLDGNVDGADFNIWNAGKFTNSSSWCAGDFNLDGGIDASDFNLWNANKFSSSLPNRGQGGLVPEPAVVHFACLIGLVLFRAPIRGVFQGHA